MLEYRILFSIIVFLFGAVFASFAGLIAYRCPKGLSIVKPRSYCPNCKKSIRFYDNIPIFSWIILKGKCRYCQSSIGVFSLLIEIIGGLGFVAIYLQYGDSFEKASLFIALILLLFLFIVMAAIDYETHDIYNITLIIYSILAVFIVAFKVFVFDVNVISHVGGLIFGFGFFGAIKIITKTYTKKDALGTGDIYLVGIGGFIVGVFPLLISIVFSTLLASIIEITKLRLYKLRKDNEIAFAPYLLLGIIIMAIYGDSFMNFYWEVIINGLI